METVCFLVLWVGAAAVHTFYELKVKGYLAQVGKHRKEEKI